MSIFSDFKPKNSANRNGFDLGRFSSFTSKVGYILPVFQQMTLPSSEYSLDVKQLLRTNALQRAAFTGFSVNYDVIWCPFNHLYSSFNQFIAQREAKNLVYQPDHQNIPTFPLRAFARMIFCLSFVDYLLQQCEQLDTPDVDDPTKPNRLRNKFLAYSDLLPYESLFLGVLRNLDMFEYCNLLPFLRNCFQQLPLSNRWFLNEAHTLQGKIDFNVWHKEVPGEVPQGSDCGLYAFFAYNLQVDLSNNLESIALAVYDFFASDANFTLAGSTEKVTDYLDRLDYAPSLFPVLAYNKAYYEYYRNQYYDDSFNVWLVNFDDDVEGDFDEASFPYVKLFNFDDFVPGYFDSMVLGGEKFLRLCSMFAVKPHQYKKDMFTGVLPTMQFGDVSVMVTQDVFSKLVSNLHPSVSTALKAGDVFTNLDNELSVKLSNSSTPTVGEKYKFDPALAISVLESRRADAMQRFKERMLRAGDNVKDIFAAQGWSEPLSESSFEPIFLGSFDGRLDINVVAATSNSQGADLGDLGANGLAVVEGSKVYIKTSDFGVLMVLFHVDKEAVYDSYGLSPFHAMVEPFDFPYPVLQNISLAPVAPEFLNVFVPHGHLVGFLPRAFQFKTALDKVHGEFYSSCPYLLDKNNNSGDEEMDAANVFATGIYADWVAPREDLTSFLHKSFLYIQPRCTDTLFKVQADSLQSSDNLIINARFDCYAVEPLPVIGLPV